MKKRKPPYVLAGLLIVALGTAIVLNASSSSASTSPIEEEPLEQPIDASAQASDTKSSLLVRMKTKAAAESDGGALPFSKKAPVLKDGPVVKRPKRAELSKPKPRPDDVSSQWYDSP